MVAWQSKDGLTLTLRLLAAVTVVGLFGAAFRVADDPDVPLLFDSGIGVWVTVDTEVDLRRMTEPLTTWQFRRRFHLDRSQPASTLDLRALRFVNVRLDDRLILATSEDDSNRLATSEDDSNWKQVHSVPIPELDAGDHLLLVEVTNQNGPAALWIDSQQPLITTSIRWEVSTNDGVTWHAVRPAHTGKWAHISGTFLTAPQAFARSAPWLVFVFVGTYVLTWRRHDPLGQSSQPFDAGHLRTLLICAGGFSALHNFWAMQPYFGFDVVGHLDYIRYVAEQGRIPLASDGWQMFQSPLYYLLNAPLQWLLADHMEPESLVRLLRAIPLACGLIQIELVYRVSRIAFPENAGMQCVAVVVGGMMPMSISMSQSIGNEPLAGCLTALTLLRFLTLLKTQQSNTRDVAALGIVWGLAMLTKVTPVLLGPVLVLGILIRSIQAGSSRRAAVGRVVILLACAAMVCGWYYVRNWILLGRPFVGGWDPSRGIVWWQYPGYRMPAHLTGFGAALVQPIYSGVHGLWDGLYSTIYADGYLSGILDPEFRPSWNEPFLIAGAWWGLLPTLLIAVGLVRGLALSKRLESTGRHAVVVAAVSVVIYLAAIVFLYLRIPIYGAAKGSYLLGLLPCLGLLAAAGAEPILRSKTGAATLAGLLACWCAGTLIAFYA